MVAGFSRYIRNKGSLVIKKFDFSDWLMEFTRPEIIWYVKRLAASDTLALNEDDAGPRIHRDFLFTIFPSLYQPESENPDIRFPLYIDSHADHRTGRAVWYNNKLRGGMRDEVRLSDCGDSVSALLDSESTGALAIFAFVRNQVGVTREAHVWVCESVLEEELAEYRVGWPVEPDQQLIWSPIHGSSFVSD